MDDDLATWRVSAVGDLQPGPKEADKNPIAPLKWAVDTATGRIRYIGSLGPDRTGSSCNCHCGHCKLPLTAVNAATVAYKLTPHFRHPPHAEKADCLILAARAAAMQTLQDSGEFVLPRRTVTAKAVGLSGESYEVSIEIRAQRVRIANVGMVDSTLALLRLDDGRELLVELTGRVDGTALLSELTQRANASDREVPTAVITINVSDPALAMLDPQELASRLELLPEPTWCAHWDDLTLHRQASSQARQAAIDALDFPDPHDAAEQALQSVIEEADRPEPGPQLRESLIHLAAKRILQSTLSIRLPAIEVPCRHEIADERGGALVASWSRPAEIAALSHVEVEKRIGAIVPDVVATRAQPQGDAANGSLDDGPLLLIEITVFNPIDEARKRRIQAVDLPTLEIDLSHLHGRVTRAGLAQLVCNEPAVRHWLHHPCMDRERQRMASELAERARPREEAFRQRRQRMAAAMQKPAQHWVHALLDAVQEHVRARANGAAGAGAGADAHREARSRVTQAAEALWTHGLMPKLTQDLFLAPDCVVELVLAVRQCSTLDGDASIALLQRICAQQGRSRQWHGVILMAVKAYKLRDRLHPEHQVWLDEWRNAVWLAIKARHVDYMRPDGFDGLLTALFPALGPMLAQTSKATAGSAAAQLRYGEASGMSAAAFHPSLGRDRSAWQHETHGHAARAVHGSFKSLPAGDKWNGLYRDLGTSPGDWPAVLNMPPKHRANAIDAQHRLWQGDIARRFIRGMGADGQQHPGQPFSAATVVQWCAERFGTGPGATREDLAREVQAFLSHLVSHGYLSTEPAGYVAIKTELQD